MTITRLDLDGLGSPAAIAGRILELENDLPLIIPLEELCGQLDISSIKKVNTEAFEAALVMDVNKAAGAVLLARNRSTRRTRYSLWLIPTHRPDTGRGFECQLDDLHRVDEKEQNRRRRIEAEANLFASALIMPPRRVRSQMGGSPNLRDIVALAAQFGVSKEAMARAYVDASREPIAVLVLHRGLVTRAYRNLDFPWIDVRIGQRVPSESIGAQLGQRLRCPSLEKAIRRFGYPSATSGEPSSYWNRFLARRMSSLWSCSTLNWAIPRTTSANPAAAIRYPDSLAGIRCSRRAVPCYRGQKFPVRCEGNSFHNCRKSEDLGKQERCN